MAVNSFAEEAVFRGLALAVLLPLGFWRAVLWTSLAFGFLHVVRLLFGAELAPTLVQMAFATNFGLLMGALRLRTGTIWWPVLAHTVVNVAGSLAAETNETWGLVVSLIWQVGSLALAIALMPSPRTSARAAATRAVPA
jgi:membrane protease YdiL (CAAX protease family)